MSIQKSLFGACGGKALTERARADLPFSAKLPIYECGIPFSPTA